MTQQAPIDRELPDRELPFNANEMYTAVAAVNFHLNKAAIRAGTIR